jgi:hypothetical protein
MLTGWSYMEKDDASSWMRSLGYFSIIVGDIAGYTGAGVGIGYLAWKKWGAPWWVLLLTSVTGLTLAFYRLYRLILKDESQNPSPKP